MEPGGETLMGVRTWTAATSLAILAAAGAADALLRWLVRRKVRRDRAAAAAAAGAPGGRLHWFDRGLQESVPPLTVLLWVVGGYAALAPVLVETVPPAALAFTLAAFAWTRTLAAMAALVWLLWRVGRTLEAAAEALTAGTANAWDDALLPVAGAAARTLLPLLALMLGIQALPIPDAVLDQLGTGLALVVIATSAYLLYRCVEAAERLLLGRYRLDVRDNLQARAVYTQVTVMKRIITAVILIFTAASMLMVFESVRQFGTSILASAGIAGLIVGFAAQRSIATVLAGLQIALTQPIRLDDVVIVENEWGRVEDITLTYVTVRIWDERRLIVPITHFIERPFQNWTRTSAEILGTVFLHVDYSAPLDAIRGELDRILDASPYWDRRVKVLQVTDARERTIEIRALASAADASLAWDLRCEVREKLIGFLQRHHPHALPRLRAELQPALPRGDAIG